MTTSSRLRSFHEMRGKDCASALVYILSVCTFRLVWTFSSGHILMANCLWDGRGAQTSFKATAVNQAAIYWFQDCAIYGRVPKKHTCSVLHLGVCLNLCACPAGHTPFVFTAGKPADPQLQHSSVERWGPLLPCWLQISVQISRHSRLLHLLIHCLFLFYGFLSSFPLDRCFIVEENILQKPQNKRKLMYKQSLHVYCGGLMRYFADNISMFSEQQGILKVYEIMHFRASPNVALFQLFLHRENKFCPEGWPMSWPFVQIITFIHLVQLLCF